MRHWVLGTILVLAAVAGFWRFFDLDRDPDVVTESSQELWGDPVYYLYNARTRVLFGDWRPDESGAMYIAPGYTLVAFLWMSLFGTAFTNTVILATLAGFVVVFATAMFARASAIADDLPASYAAGAASVLLLGSYAFFAHQRVSNGDMEALATSTLAALALVCLPVADVRRRHSWFRCLAVLAGVGIGMAPFIKFHNGIFSIGAVAAWTLSYFLFDETWRARWRQALPWIVAGLAAAAVLWILWAVWLYHTSTEPVIQRELDRLRIFSVVTATAEHPDFKKGSFVPGRFFQSNLLYRQPIETLLGTLGFFTFLTRRRRNWPLLFACVWWLTGFAVLSTMPEDPLRYRLIVWPAIVVLTAHFWSMLAAGRYEPLKGPASVITIAGVGVSLGVVGGFLAAYVANRVIPLPVQFGITALAIAGTFIIVKVMNSIPAKTTALFLALSLVLFGLPQWIAGERKVSHELQEARQRLDKYPQDTVLGGGWAVRLAFSTPRDAYFLWTPGSLARVQLFIEDPYYLPSMPLPWHELERHTMRRLPLEIAFVRIDRQSEPR